MSRTTSLDDDYLVRPKVQVTHYRPDFHTLSQDVGGRAVGELSRVRSGCIYLNPIVTIRCSCPHEAFFEKVWRFQAQWCRRAKTAFSERGRRNVAEWVGGGEVLTTKYGKFLDRSLCFTGILFIDGKVVAPHDWPCPRKKFRPRNHEARQPIRQIETLD